MHLGLRFGALSPRIYTQLKHQGFKVVKGTAAFTTLTMLERHATSLTYLWISRLLSDKEVHRARMRLLKKVIELLESSADRIEQVPVNTELLDKRLQQHAAAEVQGPEDQRALDALRLKGTPYERKVPTPKKVAKKTKRASVPRNRGKAT